MSNKMDMAKEHMQKQHLPRRCCRRTGEMAKTGVSNFYAAKRAPVNKVLPAAFFFNLDLEEFT